MKNKKSSAGGLIFRAVGFLVAGVMTSMVFLGTLNTNSWFTSQMKGNLEVTAASTEDILKVIELEGDKLDDGSILNPTAIRLKKGENIEYSPVIYFEISDDAYNYILHINPIKLTEKNEVKVPIEVSVNNVQFINLDKKDKNEHITGIIRIKYLNEFIDEELKVTFTSKYLIEKYKEEISKGNLSRIDIVSLIVNIASSIDWFGSTNYENSIIGSPSKLMQGIETQGIPDTNSEEELYQYELLEIPIDKLVFSSEQSKIIDIIAPTLQKYLDYMYDLVVNLVEKINQQIRIIAGLQHDIQVLDEETIILRQQLEDTSIERDNQKEENEVLKSKNQVLSDQNEDLLKDIEDLKDEIEDLDSSLRKERSANDRYVDSLREEITKLKEELENEKSYNAQQPEDIEQEPDNEIEVPVEEETADETEDEIEEEELIEEVEDPIEEEIDDEAEVPVEEEETVDETEDEIEEEEPTEEVEDPIEEEIDDEAEVPVEEDETVEGTVDETEDEIEEEKPTEEVEDSIKEDTDKEVEVPVVEEIVAEIKDPIEDEELEIDEMEEDKET